jgi:hypothetical protein
MSRTIPRMIMLPPPAHLDAGYVEGIGGPDCDRSAAEVSTQAVPRH